MVAMDNKTIGIHFGALCDSIKEQLDKQGFKYDPKRVKYFQRHADAITTLRFGDLLTDSMLNKINQKLYKKIVQHVAQKNKVKNECK